MKHLSLWGKADDQVSPDVNISSSSWQPQARLEIPNCIRGHGPSLPVCIPNPVSAMFHYLNYYRLTQRWTWPRTPQESQWWVERGGQRIEVERKNGCRQDTPVCAGWTRTKAGTEKKTGRNFHTYGSNQSFNEQQLFCRRILELMPASWA